MEIKEKDAFIKYLTDLCDIEVVDGRVKLEDSDEILKMYHLFRLELAKDSGLPPALAQHGEKTARVFLSHLERNNQDYIKHSVELSDTEKHYDDDTWSGMAEGSVKNLWSFLTEECGLDVDSIEKELLQYIKTGRLGTLGE